jgi:fatty acid desaturase
MTTYSTNTAIQSESTQTNAYVDQIKTASKTPEFRALAVLSTLLALWGTAIAVFGYPALIIVALALVPIIFTLLLLITVGK